MADVNSNININFNTTEALAQLRRLQAGLSSFHQQLAEGNLAAANAQKGLNAQLVQAVGATGKFAVSQAKVASSTLAFTTALEKNKLSLTEYYRYSMAAATANTKMLGKAFAQEREIINRARRDRVKSLQAQYIQMAKAQGGFIDAMRIMPRSLQMANGRFTELGTRIQYAAQRQQLLNQLLKQGSTQLLNFGKNMQWAGRQLMVGLTIPLTMLGGYASKAFRELEQATVKFRRVYGDAFTNDAEVEAAVQNIKRLANEFVQYGVSVKDTMDMAASAAAAGFQGTALTQQVKTATKLAVLGQIEQQQALETTISLQNAFGISSEDLAKKIDFLNAVENQTVLNIEDLTIAIPKAAPVIKQLGGSVEDLAFFMTAMKEGGINASEGANALKSGLASLINPTKTASNMLAGFGINIKGIIEANKGDLKGIVVGFARALDTLDPLNRARAIEQLFGKFQFARLSTLFQNVTKEGSQAARAFDLAGASVEELAILSEREMKKVQDAVGTKFQAAVEQFKQDIMPLGKAFLEAVTPIVKFFGKLFEKFNNLSDGTKKAITIIIGVLGGLGPIALMTFGLLANGIANLIKLFALIRGGAAKLNGQTNILGAGFNYLTQEQIEQQAAGQALHNTHTRLVEVFNIEKTAAMQLASAYNMLASQMRNMASQNPALFAGGLGGANTAISKLPKGRVGFEDGVISVPGPKGAGDIVPAVVSPGEAIIPAKTAEKHRGLITAMFQDKVPGFATGKLPGTMHPAPARVVDLKNPKTFAETQTQRFTAEQLSNAANSGKFAKMKPTDFGTLLQPNTGRSFPVPGIGGIYRQKNGQLVVVKPTIDETTAMAEIRSNDLTRLHDLSAPKMSVQKMIDPTDPEGKRSYLVLVSKYDKRFSPESMTGKFTKKDMIKQLVASTIRGDKDLQMSNVSGRMAPDASNAYIMAKASGFRGIAGNMPSMEEMALINTLAVKGGAKKFFATATASEAAKMTAQQYQDEIVGEINRVIPLYKKEILQGRNFKNLTPEEQAAYNNVIERLEAGKHADWKAVHAAHVRAGGNVPKYETGLNPSSAEKVMTEQISKFALGNFNDLKQDPTSRNQIDTIVKRLGKDAITEIEHLRDSNPKQYDLVTKLLLKKGIAADNITQHDMLKYVKDEMVYKDGLYYDKKSIEAGANPLSAGKTYEEVKKNVLYRLGAGKKNGEFSNPKKMNVSKLRFDMSPTGKQSGSWKQAIPRDSLLYKALRSEEQRYKAENAMLGKNDSLLSVKESMKALGYTDKQIAYELRPELSHIAKTGEIGRGAAKWLKGSALFDARLLNNYMNTGKRTSNIIDWNERNNNPLRLTPEQIKEFKNAASYMSGQNHPTNISEVKLVRTAAQLDVIAEDFLNSQSKKPRGFPSLGEIRQSKAVAQLIDNRLGTGYYNQWRPQFNLASGPGRATNVLVNPNREYMVDTATGAITKLTTANTAPKPAGAIPHTGKSTDSRMATETQTRKVATAQQVRSMGRSFVMTGRDTGNPNLSKAAQGRITKAVQDQQRLLRAQNRFTELEIRDALGRYRNKKIQEELSAANARRKIQLDKEEIRNRQTKQLTEKQQRRTMRQEKVGRFSGGASMALGTAGMAAMMAGNQGLGMGLMGASTVAGMAPMFAGMGPTGWAITGITAVVGGMYLLDRAAKKAAESQSAYVDSVTATTEKMQKIGELTGKVGASEIMARRRTSAFTDKYTTGFERGKEQFGTTFLQNATGKSMLDAFTKDFATAGDVAVKRLALELSAYVSDGIMSAEQANSVARAIGINLQDMTLGMKIKAEVVNLIGPNGEDLTNNPLKARVNLVNQSRGMLSDYLKQGIEYTTPGVAKTNQRKEFATGAAFSVQNLELNQAQLDSFNLYYEKQIASLQKQKEATSDKATQLKIESQIADLESQRADGQKTFAQNNQQIINDQLELFKLAGGWGANQDAFFDSLKAQVRTKYKGTSQEAFVDPLLKQTAGLKSKELEVKINTLVAAGDLPPATATQLMATFAGDEKGLEKTFDLFTKVHDAGAVTELINSLGGLKDPELKKTIMMNAAGLSPDELKEYQGILNLLNTMDNKEINVETFIKNNGTDKDPLAGFKELSTLLGKVEKFPKKITKTTLLDVQNTDPNMPSMQGLIDTWSQYENLPDEVKKTVVQEYISIYKTIGKAEAASFISQKTAGLPSDVADRVRRQYITGYDNKGEPIYNVGAIAAELTPQAVKGSIGSKTPGPGGGTGAGTKQDPYEFLLARLKNVRNAAINAAGGIGELNKALAAGNLQSVANKYQGIEQQLQKMGMSRQVSDWLMNMDPTEQAKWMRTATKTVTKGKNKGRVIDPFTGKLMAKGAKVGDVVLSGNAQTMAKGMDAAIIGEFNSAAGKSLAILNEQEITRRKLRALGYDSVAIERILQDEYTTSAIANGKITEQDLKTNAALNNQVVLRDKINNLISDGLKASEQAANVTKIPKVLEFFQKMSKEGIKLSNGAMMDMIGNPDQLSAAIAAMNDYESNAAGARDRLKEIVDGLNAIKANSDIKLIFDFVSKNPAEKAQAGFEAAKRVMAIRTQMYSNMTTAELPNITTADRTLKDGTVVKGKNIGQQAIANVAARYQTAGVKVPTTAPGQTLESVKKQRTDLAKTMQIGQQALSGLQQQYSAKQDALRNAQENLSKALDDANKKYDDLIKVQENKISGLEKDIKTRFEKPIDDLNKKSNKYSNDLAIIDHSAQQINDKYDKQAEALQKINEINQDIAASQQQQLDLADALTQGDISAAARAAQTMRASEAERNANLQSTALEQARQNEINALTVDGKTKAQILEEQYQISQQIYALENDPERLKLEQQILDAKAEIEKLDAARVVEIDNINKANDALITKLQGELDSINAQVTAQQTIMNTLQEQDDTLASQETYLQSIVDEATALDDSTGMTLEKWQETADKLVDIEKLAEDYATSLAAAEASASATDASWTSILDTINKIPESVTTKHIITEIRNITENITRYVNTVETGNTGKKDDTTASKAPGAAWISDGKGGWIKPTKPIGDYYWDDNKGWQKEGSGNQNNQDYSGDDAIARAAAAAARAKAEAEAKAKAEAEAAKNAMYDPNDPSHKGSFETGWSLNTWVHSMGVESAKSVLRSMGYWADGGFVARGTDTIPAMLTPGEFIMSKYAVDNYGVDKMKAINSGKSIGDSVYNYSVNVNVKSDANPDEIARAVMTQIQRVDSQKLRSVRI